ncbi:MULTISPECIES: hypothetical protein [unclassified Archaeoglobus]|jgi:hypothetical protein|uniref:hypothetical protein n=1 Tax=unclassified Archaeoglobus TaxID=2643606 RepID=UPI0025BBD762|nr:MULTISPECIES: hypothetical protein [unclassified Archaeoglobus]
MVMYFKNETVLSFLLENGLVYTLRKHLREKNKDGRTVIDWMTPYKGCKKVATALVTWIGLVDLESRKVFTLNDSKPKPLEDFVKFSGFGCVEDWINAYRAFAGKKTKTAHLYKVVLMKIHGLR